MILPVSQLMPIISACLERGQQVRFAATGGSMRPFIHHGDVVELEPLTRFPLVGDVLLVRCGPGGTRYVLHRLVRVKGDKLFIRGDAQECCEGPFTPEDILGRVTKTYVSGRVRRFDTGIWRLAALSWHLCFPVSVWLLRLAVHLRGEVHNGHEASGEELT